MDKDTANGAAERESDARRRESAHRQAPPKKAYQKPVLSKHEQLHGIGLGSP